MIELFYWGNQSLYIEINDGKIYLCAKIGEKEIKAEINPKEAAELKKDWISFGTVKIFGALLEGSLL